MNKTIQYISLGISSLFLVGIGVILDRVGGFGIRTDDVSASVTLSFSQPALLGVPLLVRWKSDDFQNIGVTLRVVSGEETVLLGTGQLLMGAMSVEIPCSLPPGPLRLELLATLSGGILGVSELDTLPPGPDCVR